MGRYKVEDVRQRQIIWSIRNYHLKGTLRKVRHSQ